MAAIRNIPLSTENCLNRIQELEGLISDRERQLVKLNNSLEKKIETLTAERDSLLGQVKNFDKWRQDLIDQTKQKLKEKEEEHQRSKNIAIGVNRSRETELTREVERLNRVLKERNQETKELEDKLKELDDKLKEQEVLLKSREEELEKLKAIEGKLDYVIELNETILNTVKQNDIKLIETVSKPDVSVEEVKKTIESNKKRLETNVNNKQRVLEENQYILRCLMDGQTQKQIADTLWPNINSRYSKISERIKTKWFDDKIRAGKEE